MTYIIAGKLNGDPFLMSDCISTQLDNNHKTYRFSNKLIKFSSAADSYFAIAGSKMLSHAINVYDSMMFGKHDKMNFDKSSFLNGVIGVFKNLADSGERYGFIEKAKFPKENKIFVINNGRTFVYTFNIDVKQIDIVGSPEVNEVLDNYYLTSDFSYGLPERMDSSVDSNNLQDYCRAVLNKMNQGPDFKDRFSFIQYQNGKSVFTSPYKDESEIGLDYYAADYSWV